MPTEQKTDRAALARQMVDEWFASAPQPPITDLLLRYADALALAAGSDRAALVERLAMGALMRVAEYQGKSAAEAYRAIVETISHVLADALGAVAHRPTADEESRANAEKGREDIPPSRVTLQNGQPVTPDHREIDLITGLQKGYVVLSEEERAQGFVRPVRDAYVHQRCGTVTRMGRSIAETYARDPKFYGGTYCAHCRAHFSVGEDGEFVWDGTDEKVGT